MLTTVGQDFPILHQKRGANKLVYLDSAASAQKPRHVLDAIGRFCLNDYANIHRGIYELSQRATTLFENTRQTVASFMGAASKDDIVFVKGTTEGINLIAQCLGRERFQAGDEIILSEMEHHANIVPWLFLKEQLGVKLKVIPVTVDGALDLEAYKKLFSSRTKLVTAIHASNVLGTINPVKEITAIAHQHHVPVLIDGAQAVPHMPVDVSDIGCDFYVFSAHKLYGPTGIGVLYAKKPWLDVMPPYQGGGGMIETVSFEKVAFVKGPQKFEAGTPNIAGAVGLEAAIHYVNQLGMEKIRAHGQALLSLAHEKLSAIPGLRMIGTAADKVPVISFVMDHIHPHDLGTILDNEGVAVRAGHHCAMPLMERFNVPATVRASFGIYNTKEDIAALVRGIETAVKLFA